MGLKVSMLEYCKIILEKFSFSRRLFRKEYRKSLRFLEPEEKSEFRKWVREKFASKNKVSADVKQLPAVESQNDAVRRKSA